MAKAKRLLCREAFHYREHPLMDHVRGLLAPGNAQAVAAAERAALGALRSIDVQVLIPAWVFGGANIRWQETLAGGFHGPNQRGVATWTSVLLYTTGGGMSSTSIKTKFRSNSGTVSLLA